ncbi:hypothetical protein [uncultured Roseobacter sp.]|uniref:hypothetical protein n=1 Tax=uncultured Roseobacter sp. TaxID=114847 RepID=UPI00262326DB|nr:hypothetical protein [uncultured Roseobacter sp.]
MNRRGFLAVVGAVLAAPAYAHTPYGQWVVYRQKHLLVGSHRGDLRTYDLAKEVVAALEEELPEAQARVARGPRPQRIASLLGTGQLFLAVMSADEALRMARAETPFEGYPPTPVHAVAALDPDYLLFAAPEFPRDHGRLVAQAVDHAGLGVRPTEHTTHAGAAAYWS